MSVYKKIILFLFISIFSFSCSNSETKKKTFKTYNTKEVLGSWRIVPSENAKVIFEKDARNYLIKEEKKIEIFALEDARGLRLQYNPEDDTPFAYFLFSEKSNKIWTGVVDNQIVRMVREVKTAESILE